jgi:hypothetical protein
VYNSVPKFPVTFYLYEEGSGGLETSPRGSSILPTTFYQSILSNGIVSSYQELGNRTQAFVVVVLPPLCQVRTFCMSDRCSRQNVLHVASSESLDRWTSMVVSLAKRPFLPRPGLLKQHVWFSSCECVDVVVCWSFQSETWAVETS